MYGKWINGVLYVAYEPKEGYKPFVFTEEPIAHTGYHTAYFWKEETDSFMQTWEVLKDYEEDINDSEALSIMLGEETE